MYIYKRKTWWSYNYSRRIRYAEQTTTLRAHPDHGSSYFKLSRFIEILYDMLYYSYNIQTIIPCTSTVL